MANFRLSAFADEYSPIFAGQIEGLHRFGIDRIELRGLENGNVASLSAEDAKEIKKILDSEGIALSAAGSPLGKISINGNIEEHLELTRRVSEVTNILGCGRIRAFSFYDTCDGCREKVIDAVGRMIDIMESAGVLFCHENEKGIYGDTPERCLDLKRAFGDRIGIVFDHANFIQCGCEPFPGGFEMLGEHITYMHIKDAKADGTVVPAGEGIGRIEETLRELDRRDGEIILTLEPHLRVFKGLEALEHGEKSKLEGAYSSAEEAFAAAVDAIRGVIGKIK